MIRLVLLGFLLLPSLLHAGGRLTVTWLEMPVHGLAVVMETPAGKVFLIDAGGIKDKPEPGYNAGRDTVSPFLKSRGFNEIEGMVISHPHGDHYGGVEWLLNNWKVKQYLDHGYEGRGQSLSYTRLRGLAQQRGGVYRSLHLGDTIELDPALKVEVLSPPLEFLDPNSDPAKVSDHGLLNSNSVVLRVQHGRNVFIFPGDAYGGTFEKHMKASVAPEKLKATVLTANHHGFNPGIDFPKMVMPKYVVVSCVADYPGNAGTPYTRSPGDKAAKVYGDLGAEVFVTAFHGNITAVSDGDSVVMTKAHERTSPPPAP